MGYPPLLSLRPGSPPVGPADLALATLVAVVLAGAAVGGGVAGAPWRWRWRSPAPD